MRRGLIIRFSEYSAPCSFRLRRVTIANDGVNILCVLAVNACVTAHLWWRTQVRAHFTDSELCYWSATASEVNPVRNSTVALEVAPHSSFCHVNDNITPVVVTPHSSGCHSSPVAVTPVVVTSHSSGTWLLRQIKLQD